MEYLAILTCDGDLVNVTTLEYSAFQYNLVIFCRSYLRFYTFYYAVGEVLCFNYKKSHVFCQACGLKLWLWLFVWASFLSRPSGRVDFLWKTSGISFRFDSVWSEIFFSTDQKSSDYAIILKSSFIDYVQWYFF